MYENFFGFKENPFRLVPNPTYLFLSKSHEEALAHLKYAISQGNGFAKIIGEVGTGKTTLCRAFLENLDRDTEAAYIFNPKLNSLQLLKAVNDEFGIPSDGKTTKDLIDVLNAFLISQKSRHRNVVLLIDEAQNLSPAVLEQIRLLSNLETTQSKLLQIILVGQPELDNMLASPELRQLEQRISLSYRLAPLSFKETKAYIGHRISIASRKPGTTFSQEVVRAIFDFSRGIPRRINIACDRTLLTAFGMGRKRITKKIAKIAVREIGGSSARGGSGFFGGRRHLWVLSMLAGVLLWFVIRPPDLSRILLGGQTGQVQQHAGAGTPTVETRRIAQPPPASDDAALPIPAPLPAPPLEAPAGNATDPAEQQVRPAAQGETVIEPDLESFLSGLDIRISRQNAFHAVRKLWDIEAETNPNIKNLTDDGIFFELASRQIGLSCQLVIGDLALLKRLNLPAILALYSGQTSGPVYLAVARIEDNRVILTGDGSEKEIAVSPEALHAVWSGVAYILWKDFMELGVEMPAGGTRETVLTLKILLLDLGFTGIDLTPVYDEPTRQIIIKVQHSHGLNADGIVGPLTKIVLYNDIDALSKPQLRVEQTGEETRNTDRETL